MPDNAESSESPNAVDLELQDKIFGIIAREGMIERATINPESTLDDLGVQSIDVVIILNAIEDELKIYVPIDQTMTDVKTAGDLVNAILKLSRADTITKTTADAN